MADHRVVGQAVIDAVAMRRIGGCSPSLLDDGLEPWGGVRWIALSGSPPATHAVDMTGTLERGIALARRAPGLP